jgi:hypothetical protein
MATGVQGFCMRKECDCVSWERTRTPAWNRAHRTEHRLSLAEPSPPADPLPLPLAQHTRVMDDLLRQIESRAHRRGWDTYPELLVIYDATDQATTARYQEVLPTDQPSQRGRYAARLAVPITALEPSSIVALYRAAVRLKTDRAPGFAQFVMGSLAAPGFVGMALQHEAWSRTTDQPGAFGPTRYVDLPDSQEQRHVMAVDRCGARFGVVRERGHEVTSFLDIEGAGIQALAVFVAVVAGTAVPDLTLTPRGWDEQAEGFSGTMSAEEMIAEMQRRWGIQTGGTGESDQQ